MRFLSVLFLALLPAAFSGCVAVVAAGGAAGGVAYVGGQLKTQLAEEVEDVNEAVLDAMDDFDFSRIEAATDNLGGKFVYRSAKDRKITITTSATSDETTELGIRIGILGDKDQSRMLLDAIRDEL